MFVCVQEAELAAGRLTQALREYCRPLPKGMSKKFEAAVNVFVDADDLCVMIPDDDA